MSDADERFMRRALELARQTMLDGAGPPFGAVVVRDGEIVAEGAARQHAEQDPTWHAEMAALRAASRRLGTLDLEGCTIYATGEPCPMCAGAIYMANLDGLVFAAFADEEIRWRGCRYPLGPDQLALPTLERPMPTRQILAAEGAALFQEFRQRTS